MNTLTFGKLITIDGITHSDLWSDLGNRTLGGIVRRRRGPWKVCGTLADTLGVAPDLELGSDLAAAQSEVARMAGATGADLERSAKWLRRRYPADHDRLAAAFGLAARAYYREMDSTAQKRCIRSKAHHESKALAARAAA